MQPNSQRQVWRHGPKPQHANQLDNTTHTQAQTVSLFLTYDLYSYKIIISKVRQCKIPLTKFLMTDKTNTFNIQKHKSLIYATLKHDKCADRATEVRTIRKVVLG